MKVSDGTPSGSGKVIDDRTLSLPRVGNRDAHRRRRRWVGNGQFATPPRQWKSHERVPAGDFIPAVEGSVSARKIAARVWRFASAAEGGARWRFGLFHHLGFKFNSSPGTPKYAIEGPRKWKNGYLDLPIATFSVASALQDQLIQARNRIKELEAKRQLSKMKLKRFKTKLAEERSSWIKQERQKMGVTIERLKERKVREKRKFHKMEVLNSKLLSHLADSKKSAKQFMQNYKKEKNAREFMQEVGNVLAKEIEKEKAETRAFKSECRRIQENVEEQRNMLQIVEAWREECVQVKLAHAKLILEEKYAEMSNIIAGIETLIRSSNVGTTEDSQINKAKGRRDDGCFNPSPRTHSSRIHHVSSEVESVSGCTSNMHSDKKEMVGSNSSHIPEEFGVKDTNGCIYISSGKPEEDHGNSQCSEISSVLSKKPKRKGSSARKLTRTSIDGNAKRLNGSSSNVSCISQERVLGHDSAGHWCPPDPRNPHIVRAMQGCTEWRRGTRRQGSRAEGMEARLASQKTQLFNVLKQRY